MKLLLCSAIALPAYSGAARAGQRQAALSVSVIVLDSSLQPVPAPSVSVQSCTTCTASRLSRVDGAGRALTPVKMARLAESGIDGLAAAITSAGVAGVTVITVDF